MPDSQTQGPEALRLHPMSFLFLLGGLGRQLAVPLLALLFAGGRWSNASMIAAVGVSVITLFSVLKARAFQYSLDENTLHIRDGLIDRTQRHIPFSRIHNVSQRRKLLHRLLNVTELHLESASGTKPEAVMRVLGLREANDLEALLRGKHALDTSAAPHPTAAVAGGEAPAPELLLALPWADVIRVGIASNRGLVMVAVIVGAGAQSEQLRKQAAAMLEPFRHWVAQTVTQEVQAAHGLRVAFSIVGIVLLAWLMTRVLSVALAIFRYHRFRLERQGDKLLASHGLSTQVRAGVRLNRLQRWQIDETWLHRRMGRCRVSVTVAGGSSKPGGGAQGADPGMQFTELAPIATWPQAQSLMVACLPTLAWDALQWQQLHKAGMSRLWSQGRWWLGGTAVLLAFVTSQLTGPLVVVAWLLSACALIAWLAYTARWAATAAYAVAGSVLVFRSGVWHRRWVIVETSRLHVLRIHTSRLDRRLGLASFQASAQGGSQAHRTLDIPYLPLGVAHQLRETIWARLLLTQ